MFQDIWAARIEQKGENYLGIGEAASADARLASVGGSSGRLESDSKFSGLRSAVKVHPLLSVFVHGRKLVSLAVLSGVACKRWPLEENCQGVSYIFI